LSHFSWRWRRQWPSWPGWPSTATRASDLNVAFPEQGEALATFVLRDAAGHPIDEAKVKLWLTRPTQDGMDQSVAMNPGDDGHYTATIRLPRRGMWDAQVSAVADGRNFQIMRRIIVP
jgi:nitrogen fixation protein FixH